MEETSTTVHASQVENPEMAVEEELMEEDEQGEEPAEQTEQTEQPNEPNVEPQTQTPQASAAAAISRIEVEAESQTAKPSKPKPPPIVVREKGKTLLPLARVQKIMKADKLLPVCAKEASVLIAIATEEFIKRIILSANAQAAREKRNTISQKDIAVIVKRQDELLFLEEIIPIPGPTPARPRVFKPQPANPGDNQTLTAFMGQGKAS